METHPSSQNCWRAALAISSMDSKGFLLVPCRAWLQSRWTHTHSEVTNQVSAFFYHQLRPKPKCLSSTTSAINVMILRDTRALTEQRNLYAVFHPGFNIWGRYNSEIIGNPQKIQECDDKMEMFWFSALDIQNLTDRPSDASCFLCLTLASPTHGRAGPSELVPYVWNSRWETRNNTSRTIWFLYSRKSTLVNTGALSLKIKLKTNPDQAFENWPIWLCITS